MPGQNDNFLDSVLFYVYLLFAVTSTVSIAAAQVALGLSLILFLIILVLKRYNPFPAALKWFYLFTGAYILWLVVSAAVNSTPLASLLIMKEEWLFCAVPIGVYLFGQSRHRDRLVAAFAVAILLVSLYGLIQHFTGINWFKDSPPVFERAKEQFAENIERWGYQKKRTGYETALAEADLIVSTAHHEFFGISVLEAIAAGAYPVLPNRLSYPELLAGIEMVSSDEFFYDGTVDGLAKKLLLLVRRAQDGNLWGGDSTRVRR